MEGNPAVAVSHVTNNRFRFFSYGSYMWVYVLAPYLAALPAGLLARYHMNNLEAADIGDNEVFLNK